MLLKYKIAASMFWLAFSLAAYWDNIPKALFFGVAFGAPIWMKNWGSHLGGTPRSILLIFGSFAVISAGLILGLQVFAHPLLSAILAVGFIGSAMLGRLKTATDSKLPGYATPECDIENT